MRAFYARPVITALIALLVSALPALAQGIARVVNVAPDLEAEFVVNGTSQTLGFREAGERLSLPLGSIDVQIVATGSGVLLDTSFTLEENRFTTLFAVRNASGKVEIVALTAPTTKFEAPNGKAHLRVFHASPDVGVIDIETEFSDAVLARFDGTELKEESGFGQVPSGLSTFKLFPAGAGIPIAVFRGEIPEAEPVTFVVTGSALDGTLGIDMVFENRVERQEPLFAMNNISAIDEKSTIVASDISIAPNPAQTDLVLTLRAGHVGELTVYLYDIAGELAARIDAGLREPGEHRVRIGVNEIPPGSYNVMLVDGSGNARNAGRVTVVH